MNYVELGTLLTPGGAVSIAYCESQVMPWRVTHKGNGHYFSNPQILTGYICGRGWFPSYKADNLAEALQILSTGILVV
ncbi:MAG: hypothetical protein IJT60_03390 [Clostridia bacterium]|nr:hypothetical protein [Clostridia bacterium]MBQ7727605.1 hypothetical protein [Clostridia bacterium]